MQYPWSKAWPTKWLELPTWEAHGQFLVSVFFGLIMHVCIGFLVLVLTAIITIIIMVISIAAAVSVESWRGWSQLDPYSWSRSWSRLALAFADAHFNCSTFSFVSPSPCSPSPSPSSFLPSSPSVSFNRSHLDSDLFSLFCTFLDWCHSIIMCLLFLVHLLTLLAHLCVNLLLSPSTDRRRC